MATSDPFNLQRFLDAQALIYADVLRELGAGQKRSHWMWFIFPQILGLGFSPTSVFYAIRSLDEALAYLNHPVLGPRLSECVELTLHVEGKTASQNSWRGRCAEVSFLADTVFQSTAGHFRVRRRARQVFRRRDGRRYARKTVAQAA